LQNLWKLLQPWSWFTRPDEPVKASLREVAPDMPELLQRFDVLQKIDDDGMLLLANKLKLHRCSSGEPLFQFGDDDDREYFLVSGKVELEAADGGKTHVEGNTPDAGVALSYFVRPRQHTATTSTVCELIVLSRQMLQALMINGGEDTEYSVAELPVLSSDEAAQLLAAFSEDLRNNKFRLTSIPQTALKIRKMLSDPEINLKAVADVIAKGDPAISAKILKSGNSAFYFSQSPCKTVNDAIVRMGIPTTRQLVLSFTLRDLFVADIPELQQAMRAAWEHSVTVAAICNVIARRTKIATPDEAMIAGLLSNIGMLSAVSFLSGHPEIYADPRQMEASIHELKAKIGALVLKQWTFPAEVIRCAAHCEDWSYDNSGSADLCDLVIVAALHALIGIRRTPRIDEVPAFGRVFEGEASPERAIHFLRESKQQIDQIRGMLIT
jgi:HD-like signal output (HDOD) protein